MTSLYKARAVQWQWLLVGLALLCLIPEAHGLDPNTLLSQYVRQEWVTQNQFPGGSVNAIRQTAGGYLWIATDRGLLRFDGFSFGPVPMQTSGSLSMNAILGLAKDGDGRLWVQRQDAVVLRYSHGRFESVSSGLVAHSSQVTAMTEDGNGGVVLSDLTGGIVRFRNGGIEKLASTENWAGRPPVISMAESSNGKIWIGTLGAGLYSLEHGQATNIAAGFSPRKINCLLTIGGEELWVGTDTGLYRWDGKSFHQEALPSSVGNAPVFAMLRDRNSNLWIGTARGLVRINSQGASFSEERDLRGNGGINALFEDREGDIWIGGARGLARIRDSEFLTVAPTSGLPSDHNGPVYVDDNDRAWFGPATGGISRLDQGKVQEISTAGLGNDVAYSIAGNKDGIWIGRQRGGLTHIQYQNGQMTTKTYTTADGLAQNSVYTVYVSSDGAVWAGTLTGGVSRFKDGQFVTYNTANGLASNSVQAILQTHDGTMWFATSAGLNSLSNGKWRTFAEPQDLTLADMFCLFEDSSGMLWVGTSEGLAFFSSNHFDSPRRAPDPLREEIFGITEDRNQWLWIATSKHILRVRPDTLRNGTLGSDDLREYDIADGLLSTEGIKRSNSVVRDLSGRIWFSTSRGLSVVDPSHLAESSAPAIPHVQLISADGAPVRNAGSNHISPGKKRIAVDYTGVSLANPERVRFRYLLEGFDHAWSEPVQNREAVYTNLGPGSYRFRVVASNSDGMWNGPEAAISFVVDPAFWQTSWFRLACALTLLAGILLLYSWRLRQITHDLHLRFEERLAERTRIAQELHDTLLQGFLSASMQLHVAEDALPDTSPAKPIVAHVLELMHKIVDEGRNVVRGLRSTEPMRELDQALSSVPDEMGLRREIDFRILVEGQSRPLSPLVRDDLYRMGREALVNAFRHSGANRIQLELEYGIKELRLVVRDDGRGIDEQVLRSGREGHWGLPGMRERAERIGAQLRVWSNPEQGTEVQLSIPGHVAFESNSKGRASNWLSKLYPRKPAANAAETRKRAV